MNENNDMKKAKLIEVNEFKTLQKHDEYVEFAKWAAFILYGLWHEETWHRDSFAERACRKLYKLGELEINEHGNWELPDDNK